VLGDLVSSPKPDLVYSREKSTSEGGKGDPSEKMPLLEGRKTGQGRDCGGARGVVARERSAAVATMRARANLGSVTQVTPIEGGVGESGGPGAGKDGQAGGAAGRLSPQGGENCRLDTEGSLNAVDSIFLKGSRENGLPSKGHRRVVSSKISDTQRKEDRRRQEGRRLEWSANREREGKEYCAPANAA